MGQSLSITELVMTVPGNIYLFYHGHSKHSTYVSIECLLINE